MKKYKSNSLALLLVSIILSMLCLSFAAVPLYSIFCKATGFGGNPKKSMPLENKTLGVSVVKVRLSATVNDMPLRFEPSVSYVHVIPGEQNLAFYSAENTADNAISGTAIYNVSPPQAGKYFYKIACFCFTEQLFEPHKRVVMPVSFTIDPAIETDVSTYNIKEITLSYIFFPSRNKEKTR